MNSVGDGYLQNESSYVADANVTNYGESIIKNIKGVPESVIGTGAAYSMSVGTEVVGNDGNTYYFCGMATKGDSSGSMYFSTSKPGSASYGNASVVSIDTSGNVSKVIDGNGEPMVVYHGSPYANFTIFKNGKIKNTNGGLFPIGVFTTTGLNAAKRYAGFYTEDKHAFYICS